MNIGFFLIIFSISMLIYIAIGIFASRKTKNIKDFMLASRKMGFWSTMMSLVGIQLGGGMLFGGSEAAYNNGFVGIFYSLGLGLSFITMSLIGSKQLREMNLKTVSELFLKEYNSIFLRKFTSIISICGLAGLFIAQIVASKKFLGSIGLDQNFLLISIWTIIITYTMFGGIRATAYTDIIQVIIILLVFIIAIFYIPSEMVKFNSQTLLKNYDSSEINYLSLIIAPFLFCFIEQDVAQRFFAAKSVQTARKSAFFAGLVIISFGLIPCYVGLYAQNFDIAENTSPLMIALENAAGQNFLPFIAIAILAAIISTGDGPLCAIISNIMADFDLDQKPNSLSIARLITFIIGIFALISGLYFNNILKILITSYQLIICTMFVPVFACYLGYKSSHKSAYAAVFTGLITYLTSLTFELPNFLSSEILAIFFSFLAFKLFKK